MKLFTFWEKVGFFVFQMSPTTSILLLGGFNWTGDIFSFVYFLLTSVSVVFPANMLLDSRAVKKLTWLLHLLQPKSTVSLI